MQVMKTPVELDNKECAEETYKGRVIKDELDIHVKRIDVSGLAPYFWLEEIQH